MNKVKREVIKEFHKEILEYRVHYDEFSGEDYGFELKRYLADDDDYEVGMWWVNIKNNPWEDNELTETMIEDINKIIKGLKKGENK